MRYTQTNTCTQEKNEEFHVGQQWKNANVYECILISEICKEFFRVISYLLQIIHYLKAYFHMSVLNVSRIVDFHHLPFLWIYFFSPSPYLELILLVFGALVKGPVISEPPDVIELVEAFDVVRHSISLQHILTLRDGGYGVDLQVWKQSEVKEKGKEREWEWQEKALQIQMDRNCWVTWKNMGNRREDKDTHRQVLFPSTETITCRGYTKTKQ